MKIIRYLFIIILLSLSINNFTDNIDSNLFGKYYFDECYGKTAGGSSICFEFTIEIYNDNGKIKAKYNIDGFQTKRRFVCYTEMNEDMITFYFYKYDKDDIHYTEDYKNGDMLFKFIKTNNKYFITNFKSPVDGKLINKKYELKKISNG